MKLLQNILTGADNCTYSFSRISGMLGVLTFLGLSIYTVIGQAKPFDMQSFGIGFGGVMAGMGVALGFGAKSEPSAGMTTTTMTTVQPAPVAPSAQPMQSSISTITTGTLPGGKCE